MASLPHRIYIMVIIKFPDAILLRYVLLLEILTAIINYAKFKTLEGSYVVYLARYELFSLLNNSHVIN